MKTQAIKNTLLATTFISIALCNQAIAETKPLEFKEPLALQKIMLSMGLEMHNIGDAIATKNWKAIEKSATWIADHPKPPMVERMKIMSFLGTEALQFKTNDKKTHNAASDVADAAKQQNNASVNNAFATLQQTCLACHQTYRAKLQDHFYGQR